MKRVATIVILLALAAGVYFYAYPRLSGASSAEAQQATPGDGSAQHGQANSGQGNSSQASAGQAAALAQQKQGGRPGGGFPTGVVTAVAQQQDIPITKSAVGYIEPANTVVVRSRVDGTVVAVNVTDGQLVKAGDVLLKLDDRALQATIAKDQANADSAQASLEREQDLVKRGVDPQSSLDAATAAAKAAQATVTVDQASLQGDQVSLSYMTITAPIAGRLGTVNTSTGNVVHASDTSTDGIVTITEMSQLRVSFSIAEGDLDSFRAALAKGKKLPVEIRVPGDKTPRATGNLSFIDSSVDTGSGTIIIKADVDNSAGKLWPGQYVSTTTELGSYAGVTTVPLQAVQQSDSGAYVFAIGTDNKAHRVPVTVTAAVGDTAILNSKVTPGQHVVVEGQLRLTEGSAVKETVQPPAQQVADTQATGGSPPAGTGTAAPPAPAAGGTAAPAAGSAPATGSASGAAIGASS